MYVCVCVYIYIYIYTHTHTYTHILTNAYLQMDIAGFTKLSSQISAEELIDLIGAIFTSIDYLAECLGNVWKVETIGDCYIGVIGGPNPCEDHANRAVVFACNILENVKRIATRTQLSLNVRIAVHTGNITASVIGSSLPRYLIFGPDCEIVRIMEANASPGLVEVSETTAAILVKDWHLSSGQVLPHVDGSIQTYVIHMTPVNYKMLMKARKIYPRIGDFQTWFCTSTANLMANTPSTPNHGPRQRRLSLREQKVLLEQTPDSVSNATTAHRKQLRNEMKENLMSKAMAVDEKGESREWSVYGSSFYR